MAKGREKRLQLPDLMAYAIELQGAVKGLRPCSDQSERIAEAARFVAEALDALVVEILLHYLSEVEVRLDPQRPQVWDDRLAVLEVVYGGLILRIPVPLLRKKDADLTRVIRRNMKMSDKGFGFVYSEEVFLVEELPASQGKELCRCGHSLSDHERLRVHRETKFNTGTASSPRQGSHTWHREERPCTICGCK
ncbi:MAG: hypothetical protein GTO54_08910 [Nitrososphaeria archaeon]|nr:hypothetical protein [Nitrososphaeria archaeon]